MVHSPLIIFIKGAIYNVFDTISPSIFLLIYSLFIQEIVIFKATRLQAWALGGGGGGARVGRRPHPPSKLKKKVCWLHWGSFCYFFFIWGPFCYVYLIFGGIFTMWGLFCYFSFHGGGLFLGLPPPLRKFLRAPMIARRVREHSSRKFFV